MAARSYAEACAKLAESQALNARVGTLLELGSCYEKNGQTASAWAQFREAAQVAARASDSREKVARRHAADLEVSLPKLAIGLAPRADVPGLEVKRDGELMGSATLGVDVPIDPGPHTVTARAPGKIAWTATVEIAAGAGSKTVTVPVLEPFPGPAGAGPAPADPSNGVPGTEDDKVTRDEPRSLSKEPTGFRSSQRTIAVVAGGVGIVAIGIGAVFGLNAKSDLDASNADNHCRPDNHCDRTGFDLRGSFKSEALISTIGFVAGGLALAGGVALWLTAPRAGPQVAVAPAVGMRDGGLVIRGLW